MNTLVGLPSTTVDRIAWTLTHPWFRVLVKGGEEFLTGRIRRLRGSATGEDETSGCQAFVRCCRKAGDPGLQESCAVNGDLCRRGHLDAACTLISPVRPGYPA